MGNNFYTRLTGKGSASRASMKQVITSGVFDWEVGAPARLYWVNMGRGFSEVERLEVLKVASGEVKTIIDLNIAFGEVGEKTYTHVTKGKDGKPDSKASRKQKYFKSASVSGKINGQDWAMPEAELAKHDATQKALDGLLKVDLGFQLEAILNCACKEADSKLRLRKPTGSLAEAVTAKAKAEAEAQKAKAEAEKAQARLEAYEKLLRENGLLPEAEAEAPA